ncbi:MAG: hypothetical protein AAFW00_14765 [Bacteroidota bacterium]
MKDFNKSISIVGIVLGFLLALVSSFPFITENSAATIVMSSSGGILVAIATYFFGTIRENEKYQKELEEIQKQHQEKIKELEKTHSDDLEDLRKELEESGQDLLIRQYANDTCEISLINRSLKDIEEFAWQKEPNVDAIRVALKGIDNIQFMSFFNKAGQLILQDEQDQILLRKFLFHFEQVAKTRKNIPEEFQRMIDEMRHSLNRSNNRQIGQTYQK